MLQLNLEVLVADEEEFYPNVFNYAKRSAREILDRLLLALTGQQIPEKPLRRQPARDSKPLWENAEEKKRAYEEALETIKKHYVEKNAGTFKDKKLRPEEFKKLIKPDPDGIRFWTSGRSALLVLPRHRALIYAAIKIGWLIAEPKLRKNGTVSDWKIELRELLRWKIDLEENFGHLQLKELLAAVKSGRLPDKI
jgi:hypothetical protein